MGVTCPRKQIDRYMEMALEDDKDTDIKNQNQDIKGEMEESELERKWAYLTEYLTQKFVVQTEVKAVIDSEVEI